MYILIGYQNSEIEKIHVKVTIGCLGKDPVWPPTIISKFNYIITVLTIITIPNTNLLLFVTSYSASGFTLQYDSFLKKLILVNFSKKPVTIETFYLSVLIICFQT